MIRITGQVLRGADAPPAPGREALMLRMWTAAVAAALAVLAGGPAWAQDENYWGEPGIYLGGWGGYTLVTDSPLDDPATPGADLEVASKAGLGFGAVLGYRFGDGARIEAEVALRSNDMDQVEAGGVAVEVDGTVESLAGMVNVYYDFGHGTIRPYLGLGAGYARVEVDSADLGAEKETDDVFAYQGRAGLGLLLGENVLVTIGYGYFATLDPTFDGIESEYRTHNIEAGLRFGF
jgi:opacity protein-like surface antigen